MKIWWSDSLIFSATGKTARLSRIETRKDKTRFAYTSLPPGSSFDWKGLSGGRLNLIAIAVPSRKQARITSSLAKKQGYPAAIFRNALFATATDFITATEESLSTADSFAADSGQRYWLTPLARKPPSTTRVCPVTKEALSEAR